MKVNKNIKQFLIDCYLDYVNDFLTVEGYANYYGISIDKAFKTIELGRQLHYKNCKKVCA